MADGTSYENALAEAQRADLAERDPAADVGGYDATAKVMILSALVFGRQLRREEVACRGITGITGQQVREAASAGRRLRHVATLAFSGPGGAATVTARVQPEIVHADDPLASIDGVTNAVVCQASPIGRSRSSGLAPGRNLRARKCSATSSRSRDGNQRAHKPWSRQVARAPAVPIARRQGRSQA